MSPLWLGFKSLLEQIWTGGRIQIGHVDTIQKKLDMKLNLCFGDAIVYN